MVEIKRMGPTDLLTIGEIVKRTGVSASALHFYERKG
ncbi:MerR family DNA-binding transcriptional regulator, partial [Mycobacterium montefiorense]